MSNNLFSNLFGGNNGFFLVLILIVIVVALLPCGCTSPR